MNEQSGTSDGGTNGTYRRIIVPVDCSDLAWAALGPARMLADHWGADLDLFSVVQFPWEVEHSQHDIENYLGVTGMMGDADQPEVTIQVSRSLRVADELAVHADLHPGSLVVMTSHGRGRSAALLGSVAERTLRSTPGTPVMLFGPKIEGDHAGLTGRMLVCVDGSDASESAVGEAIRFGRSLDLHPWVVSVAGVSAPASVGGPGGETFVDSVYPRRVAEDMAAELGRPVDFDTLHGSDAAKAIVDYAKSYDTGLIVAATHGRTGLDRFTEGSVAMAIVHDAPCPVVLVKIPESDESLTAESGPPAGSTS